MIDASKIRFWWNGNGGAVIDNDVITDILDFKDRSRITFASDNPRFYVNEDNGKAYLETGAEGQGLPADAVAMIPNAIPASGTIVLWNDFKNTYAEIGATNKPLFTDPAFDTQALSKGHSANEDKLIATIGSQEVSSDDLEWQPTNAEKPWFFAVKYNATTVSVWRGDREGNLELVIDNATHGGDPLSVANLNLPSVVALVQLDRYSDLFTTDQQLSEQDITDIYHGRVQSPDGVRRPIFQLKGYFGDIVDKFRQKVQEEDGTYDSVQEPAIRNFLDFNIYQVYNPTAATYFVTVEDDGGSIVDRSTLAADINEFLTTDY